MRKMMLNGKEVEVAPIDIILANENWNEYTLLNGDIIKTKEVVVDIFKILNAPENVQDKYVIESRKIVSLKQKE